MQHRAESPTTSAGSETATGSEPDATHDRDPAARARAIAGEVGTAIRDGIAPVAGKVGAAVRSGMGSVGRALADPSEGAAAEISARADLPELEGEDPIKSIGVRLDREADLWRGAAMQQLARAAWMDRLAGMTTAVLLLGAAVLTAIAGFRALFATEHVGGAATLLAVGAGLLVVCTLAIGRLVSRVRQAQVGVAKDALARADRAEARLHQLAVLLELRAADREGYLAGLRALDLDVTKG